MEDGIRVEGLSPDDTVLVSGPPMTGKYRLLLQLLADCCERVVLLSTRNRAEEIRDDFSQVAPGVPEERVGVVDCVSYQDDLDVEDTTLTKYVASPSNLTDMGVKFTELHRAFQESPIDGHSGVGLHSASQLLMHAEVKNVYQFLQVLTGQARSAGWFGAAVVDEAMVGDEQVQMLKHHFDGVLETRENEEGQRQFRSRGLTPQASDWTAF